MESLNVFSAIAFLSSGSPTAGEYLWFFGSFAASIAASTIYAGVGKSGSPVPKTITSLPSALSALALAATLSVTAPYICEMRFDNIYLLFQI